MSLNVDHHEIDVEFSHDAVRMLLHQPHIEFETPVSEPFRIAKSHVARHLDAIRRLLDCTASFNPSFVLLPEYSVPGVIGIELIHKAASDAAFPHNTVLVAGVDGLSKSEYAEALGALGESAVVNSGNLASSIEEDNWVNCSISWVKDRAGAVRAWVQPKIEAAWPEESACHLQMFRGASVNLFQGVFDNGVKCRFASLLCYDWIGRDSASGHSVPNRFLERLNSDWAGEEKKVHWLFLLQHNEKPNHFTFTSATRDFLTDNRSYPCVDRSQTALVCVSTARNDNAHSERKHGFSSIIFAPGVPFNANSICPPTITSKAKNLDAARELGTCQDYVFREMRECIHCCAVRVPSFVRRDNTDRRLPVTGDVYSLIEGLDDPRRPNGPVPAAIKWMNDQLDICSSQSLSERYFSRTCIGQKLSAAEADITSRYRRLSSKNAEKAIYDSTATDYHPNIDDWNGPERKSLSHIRDSLSLCALGVSFDIASGSFHACCDTSGVELLAIQGRSHEECRAHFEKKCPQSHGPVLLISRDEENTQVSGAELKKFYEKDRGTGVKTIDYQTLLQACRTAKTEIDLVEELQKMVEIDEPTII